MSSNLYSQPKHKYNNIMTNLNRSKQSGSTIINVFFAISVLALIGVSVLSGWLYLQYKDRKTDVDGKIDAAVAIAKKEQADVDEAKFTEREKQPNREFVGPDDYGRVTFAYPRTWSVHINKDSTSGGVYEAYLNPISVPPINSSELFALRLTIKQEDYDRAIASFNSLVTSGKLSSKPISIDGTSGTQFDGNFSDSLRGSLVIFKIRDKTVTIRTDANTFKADFDAIVASIKFNQ